MTLFTLSPIVGSRIDAADEIHDYLQIKFDNGDILNVFNEYCLEGAESSGVRALVCQSVTTVSQEPHEVRIELGALRLRIDLTARAFRGPEAIEYIPASGSRVVWS